MQPPPVRSALPFPRTPRRALDFHHRSSTFVCLVLLEVGGRATLSVGGMRTEGCDDKTVKSADGCSSRGLAAGQLMLQEGRGLEQLLLQAPARSQ